MGNLQDKLNRSKKISSGAANPGHDKFATADSVMGGDNARGAIKEKVVSVAYSFPESYLTAIDDIILKCMLKGVKINKSEIVRIGILMVNELSVEEIKDHLESVSVPKGRR
ncbi:MAG: hypothetical protein EKK54_06330 [Neisseriaceae bacterium]|nr:MAG: hypothetical protein EKK54_06330 [Neisseriaceae bacterium]